MRARCATGFTSPKGRKQFVRGHFEVTARGAVVTPVGGHGSHLIGSLSQSNALVVVPDASTEVDADSTVDVMVLDRSF
ncbi:MAG: hypothetical protein H0U36_07740 [Nocardioidaceae bacterium]|nr:hypothetical protein [Nocardioidaceae bacterium]